MKKLLLIALFFGCIAQLPAQNQKLLVKGLMAANQTASMNVESAAFKSMLVNPNGNPTGNNITYKYYFKRRMDNRSAKISQGAKTGRVYANAQVWTKDHAGKVVKYKLQNAYITMYSEQYENGKPPMETFVVTYQNRTKI
jgi:type VI protein secretion system component Hcp